MLCVTWHWAWICYMAWRWVVRRGVLTNISYGTVVNKFNVLLCLLAGTIWNCFCLLWISTLRQKQKFKGTFLSNKVFLSFPLSSFSLLWLIKNFVQANGQDEFSWSELNFFQTSDVLNFKIWKQTQKQKLVTKSFKYFTVALTFWCRHRFIGLFIATC